MADYGQIENLAQKLFDRDHSSSWWSATPVTKNAYRDEAREVIFREREVMHHTRD